MARTLSDILRRFRPAAAPGPAGPAGVPADRVAEAAAELAVVFDALVSTTADVRARREEAAEDAERLRRQAAAEASRIVADAGGRREAMRAEAASASLTALDADRAALETEARAEADRVRGVAEERLPALVERVLAQVRAVGSVVEDGATTETGAQR